MNSIHLDLSYADLNAFNTKAPWPPTRYWNVFPGGRAYLLLQRFHHNLSFQEWGVVTSWFREMSGYEPGHSIPYIRASKLDLPHWEKAITFQRCMLPISGFFSVVQKEEKKRVFFSGRLDKKPIYAAGLCPFREDRKSAYGFAFITTESPIAGRLRGTRVPVAIHPNELSSWLDDDCGRQDALDIVAHNHRDLFNTFEVSADALNPRNQGPEVIEPI